MATINPVEPTMTQTLAVKPTRREILKVVLDAAKARKQEEVAVLDKKWRTLHAAASTANEQIQKIAREYANKKYKKLLNKIQKILLAEFPDAQLYFTVDLEKEQDATNRGRERFKPDGKAKVRLSVHDAERTELDLPQEVRDEMAAAKAESNRLYEEAGKAHDELRQQQRLANVYGAYDATAHHKLLEQVVPTLGAEASPHFDALIELVAKALEVPVTSVNAANAG